MSLHRERFGSADLPSPPDWEALARFLANESSVEEADTIRAWLAEHKADSSLVETLDRTLDRVNAPLTEPFDVEGAWRKVTARRDHPDVLTVRPLIPRAVERPWRWPVLALRAAAIVVLAIGATIMWQRTRRPSTTRGELATVFPARTVTTGVGERDSVRLSDSSVVILGALSELTVDAGYGGRERSVRLRGEAYFDVRHDDARGFVVHAGGAAIRDVGTTFGVRADGPNHVRVAVRSGAVLLGASADSAGEVVLHEGDIGELQQGGRLVVKHAAPTGDDVAWMTGRLVFRERVVSDVAVELKRWYGMELQFADRSLAERHVTISFAGESRERALQMLALTLGASVEMHGDTAVLRPREGRRDEGRRRPPGTPDAR
jgi:transmembrane sensor